MTHDDRQDLDEIIAEYLQAQEAGKTIVESDIIDAHPEFADELLSFFNNLAQIDQLASPLDTPAIASSPDLEKIRSFGDYELLQEIARGGMGVVYKARQASLNRIVAVKLILSGHLAGDSEVKRFRTEAEAAANLKHPNIVAVHEVGQHQDQNYFSMDFIEGRNLSSVVRENPLPAKDAARYVQQIAEAIEYAHQQGTLHRDLKPSNVLIDQNDNVQITDFGLATRVEDDSELTRTGQILGTPSYMPPEQAQSERSLIGPASDVYSIGAILYELLTGRPPFRAESAIETLKQVIEKEPLSPRLLNPSVPKDLSTICLKCLRKEPHKRYATAGELAADLQRFLNSEPILARPVRIPEKMWLWCRRRPGIVATASVAFIILVAAVLVLNERRNDAEAARIVNGLLQAETSQVPAIVRKDLPGYRKWAGEKLRGAYLKSSDESNTKLHAALAMLPEDDSVLPFLKERLLTVSPTQFEFVRTLMASEKEKLIEFYWDLAEQTGTDSARRFQAACALASYDTKSKSWENEELVVFLSEHLVSVRPSELLPWRNALRLIKDDLTEPLAAIYRDGSRDAQVRGFAADILADYLSEDPEGLFDLLADADHKQFDLLLEQLARHRARAIELGKSELTRTLDRQSSDAQKEALAVRQANAAIMLLRLDAAEDAWQVFRHSADPSARTYAIHWLKHRGIAPETIKTRYQQETDVGIKRALLQCLGEFDDSQLPESRRNLLIEIIQADYLNHPDPGLHGSAKWLLKKWNATLPELPVGEPVLTAEQKQRVETLSAEVEDLRRKMRESEQQLPARQGEWEQELTEQPEPEISLNDGLVAHFPLDETEGRETAGGIEGQSNASYYGSGKLNWVPGVLGQAAKLDNQPGRFEGGKEFSPERSDAFSYGCWFLADELPAYSLLLCKIDPSTGCGFRLSLNGSVLMVIIRSPDTRNGLYLRAERRPSQGHWQHVFVTYDGSSKAAGVGLYLDGRRVDTTYLKDSLSETIQNEAPFIFGSRSQSLTGANVDRTHFHGLVDDVRVYNRYLDDYEVRQLFLSGLRSLAQVPADQRTPEQHRSLEKFHRIEDELLRTLENELAAAETAWREIDLPESRHWYVNSQGQTFAIVDADEFHMGSPASEPGRDPLEHRHRRRIGRLVAIADTEVTRAQFREFVKSLARSYPIMGPDNVQVANLAPTDDSPTLGVNWFGAAHYCNWLSEQEGIPREQWCYEPNRDGEYSSGMKAKENFWELTGYRLPTEAEWEFACRAGTTTSRFYGRTEKLLPEYAWYYDNNNGKPQVRPVAHRKPNDFGVFDLYGNAGEWVYDPWHIFYSGSAGYADDTPNLIEIDGRIFHGIRGGTVTSHPSSLRSAFRAFDHPGPYDLYHGFRLCRTFYFSPEASPVSPGREPTSGDLAFQKSVVRPEMGRVVGVEISNDGRSAYSAAFDTGSVDVFERNPETGDLIHRQTFMHPDRTRGATAVRLSKDGRLAAVTAHTSDTVILLARDLETGELTELDVARDGKQGISGLKWAMDAAFSPDSQYLYVIASRDAAVTWFRIVDGKSLEFAGVNRGQNRCLENARGIVMSPDGKTLYVASAAAGTLTVLKIDPETGEPMVRQILHNGDGIIGLDGVFSVTCSSDGRFVYTNSGCFGGDDAVCVFEQQADGTLKFLETHQNGLNGVQGLVGGNELVISPDGNSLYALGSKAGAIVCFDRDPETGTLIYRGRLIGNVAGVNHLQGVSGIAVSPDGRHIYAAGQHHSAISIIRRLGD